jgi:hypothetical protein
MADSVQTGGKALLTNFLKQFGLESLADWAWSTAVQGNLDTSQLTLLLRDRPEYKARFPAMAELAKQGRAITEQDYIGYETQVDKLAHSYGIPKGMYDSPSQIAKMLINNVDTPEINQRMKTAAAAAYSAPQEVRDALRDNYGISGGSLIAYWLDPDLAGPILERQFAAAQITGAARQQGMNSTVSESERLATMGISADEARTGFGQAASLEGLDVSLGGDATTRSTRVEGVFGDAKSADEIRRVQASRNARFNEGGGAATGQTGVSGLGSGR